ncbi:MAG: hypothetical protein RIE56_07455, partial [Amphiplicatus sp.]
MIPPDIHSGVEDALHWKTYPVRRRDKAPLLDFVITGLKERGCNVLYASEPDHAPFYVVFETPGGERQGILVYAFFANAKVTMNRPDDEHRFQIKYGGNLKGVLEVAVDPHELITTLFLGIDPERGVFIAADPLMNTPAPMSRSVEFKSRHIEEALDTGWATWERDRRPGKSRNRPTADLEDCRTEVLIGARRERLFDLIGLERIARGLDPGERHLVSDRLAARPSARRKGKHPLLDEFEIAPDALFDLIDGAARLKMAVRGWVAEQHLETTLKKIRGVTECKRLEEEGKPDIKLRWKDGPPILIE